MAFTVRRRRPERTARRSVERSATSVRAAAHLRQRETEPQVRQQGGAFERAHCGSPAGQHVGAELEQPARQHDSLRQQKERRHQRGSATSELRLGAHVSTGRSVLRLAGHEIGAGDFLETFDAGETGRARRGLSRLRLGLLQRS